MNTIDMVVDHLHSQMADEGRTYYDSPEFDDVNQRMRVCHEALEAMGLPIKGLSLAVSDLISVAEDHILEAEYWGFKLGFAAALLLKTDLMEWAKGQDPPELDKRLTL